MFQITERLSLGWRTGRIGHRGARSEEIFQKYGNHTRLLINAVFYWTKLKCVAGHEICVFYECKRNKSFFYVGCVIKLRS